MREIKEIATDYFDTIGSVGYELEIIRVWGQFRPRWLHLWDRLGDATLTNKKHREERRKMDEEVRAQSEALLGRQRN